MDFSDRVVVGEEAARVPATTTTPQGLAFNRSGEKSSADDDEMLVAMKTMAARMATEERFILLLECFRFD